MEVNSSNFLALATSGMQEIKPQDVKEGSVYYIADHTGCNFKSLREVIGIYEDKRIVNHLLEDTIDINRYHFKVLYYSIDGKEDVSKRGRRITRVPADWGMEFIAEIFALPSYILRLLHMIGACI